MYNELILFNMSVALYNQNIDTLTPKRYKYLI